MTRSSSLVAAPRALVLGGGGHVGAAFSRALLARGFRVTALGRRADRPLSLAGLDLDYRSVSSADAEDGFLAESIEGHELVVDAAADYPLAVRTLFSFHSTENPRPTEPEPGEPVFANPDRTGRSPDLGLDDGTARRALARTGALVRAVRGAGARLIFVSSFATLDRAARLRPGSSRAGDGLLSRASAALWRRVHSYFEVKRQLEDRVLAAFSEGLPAVIVNPALCLGPWDSKPRDLCLIPRLLDGEIPLAIRHPVAIVDVRDVASTALRALEERRFGAPTPVVGHRTTTEILCRRICELGRAEPPSFQLPSWIARLAATGASVVAAAAPWAASSELLAAALLFESDRILSAGAGAGATLRDPSSAKPVTRLGRRPYSLSRTLVDSIDWYQKIGSWSARSEENPSHDSRTPARSERMGAGPTRR